MKQFAVEVNGKAEGRRQKAKRQKADSNVNEVGLGLIEDVLEPQI
jgi:hypothetical protein